jgi:hypothetical protein
MNGYRYLWELLKCRRVRDGALMQLIGLWFNARVLEEGYITQLEDGSSQDNLALYYLLSFAIQSDNTHSRNNLVSGHSKGRFRRCVLRAPKVFERTHSVTVTCVVPAL